MIVRAVPLLMLLLSAHAQGNADIAADASQLQCTAALRTQLAQVTGPIHVQGVEIKAWTVLKQVYAGTGYQPLWQEATRAELARAVADSVNEGLNPQDYPLDPLPSQDPLPPEACAARELILGESLLRLAYSFRFGRTNPQEVMRSWNYPRELGEVQAGEWLVKTMRSGTVSAALRALLPDASWYRTLRDTHAALLAQAADPPWPTLGDGPTLHPGDTDPAILTLRARLATSGEVMLRDATPAEHYDAALAAEVLAFQTTHGLAADGLVGRRTRAALDVSRADRLAQLRVNLERLRWIAHDLPRRFLAVNIAAFQAGLVDEGKIIWRARTIVGRPYRQTPVFRSRITSLEINPTWTVPPGILRQDVLPALRSDPGYLQAKGLQVIDARGEQLDPATIDWTQFNGGTIPFVLRQPPGEDNALGRIKFLFANPHSVYLHDTPARDLFTAESRVFSSGCIRIERPFELAALLLAGDPDWPPERVQGALDSGRRTPVRLRDPLPILLLYLTAYVDAEGRVNYRDDVYRRDARVLAALDAPFRFSLPARDRPETKDR